MASYEQQHWQALLEGGWVPAQPGNSETPDTVTEWRALRHYCTLLALTLALVALFYTYLASPLALCLDVGALARLRTVAQFYATPPPDYPAHPGVLVIGDSVALQSVDCTLLDELTGPEGPRSYNLATPGRSTFEYLLDAAQPTLAGRTVVMSINPLAAFTAAAGPLPARRANWLSLLGASPREDDLAAYSMAVPDSGLAALAAPRYQQVLDSRWRIVEATENAWRASAPWLPPARRAAVRYARDVYGRNLKTAIMPDTYTPERIAASLAGRCRRDPGLVDGHFAPPAATSAAFELGLQRVAAASGDVVLIAAPLHPFLRERLGPHGLAEFRAYLNRLTRPGIRVLDCTELLDASGFDDELHPNLAGCQAVTRALATGLGWVADP
jgi:hypothetical protein